MAIDPKKWTLKTQEAFSAAIDQAKDLSNPELTPDHVLGAMMRQEGTIVPAVLAKLGQAPLMVRNRADEAVQKLPKAYGGAEPRMSKELTNIVENALHAMPESGVLTLVALADDSAVRIRISDTGAGMDAEALARAFEPYFSTKTTGTGLGLPIARRNVELNGGTIAVASERDRGTTVELTLPRA